MSELKKVVFFGSDPIALPILETLISAPLRSLVRVEAIYSQPDRPSGRGQKVQANAVAQWARNYNIPLYQPEKLGADDVARLREIDCDIGLVMAYGHILKQDMLDAPRLGFFNYHASLLPHFRGPAPIEAAIASGDTGTGVTLQRIVPALDKGDVVGSAVISLDDDSTRASLRERISEACTFITIDTLPRIIRGDIINIPQPEKHASYSRKISRADSAIDFSVPARMIAARTRALSPWPGCTFPFNGMEIKLGHVSAVQVADLPSAAPGTVMPWIKGELLIATGKDFLQIHSLQRPGGRMLPARDFLAGMKISAGTVLESREMIPLAQKTPWPRKKSVPAEVSSEKA